LSRLAIAIGVVLVSSATECRAGGLLPFDFDPNRPTILATDGSVSYTQSTGALSVQATGLFYLSNNLPGGAPQVPITNDSATINLTVDSSGNLIGTGSLSVTGAIDFNQDGTNDVSGTLLTGTVDAFGAAPPTGSAPWEFDGLFHFTGGDLTQSSIPLSGGGTFTDLFRLGDRGGFDLVVEQQVTGILGDFTADFSGNTNKGPVVGVAVPEPATATLGLIALAILAGWGKFRQDRGRTCRRATE
jgi:hypothetical protein